MKNATHKLTIKVTPDSVEAEMQATDPEQAAYIEKYLSGSNDFATRRTYIQPQLHDTLTKMVKVLAPHGATIGSYLSAIVLDHFAKNADLMKRIFEDSREDLFT